jgi:hypothetical protein
MSTAQQDSDVGTVREKPAVRKRAPRKAAKPKVAQPEVRPPEEFTILAPESKVTIEAGGEQFLSVEEFRKKLAGPPEGTYPEGTELFSYTPTNGETIWFPLNGFQMPGAVWLWEQYEKPFHAQSWEWMNRAKIPRWMQRKAVELEENNLSEYMDMFEQWFKALSGGTATPGES